MAQVFEDKPHFSRLAPEETFEESSRSLISIPKKYKPNYRFTTWLPKPSAEYPEEKFPILPSNPLLASFIILTKSRQCDDCGNIILPRLNKNMSLPEICPKCKNVKEKPQMQSVPQLTKSDTLSRLRQLLDSAFDKYYQYANFHEKNDYTENFFHKLNHEIYLNETIIQDASEIKTCIESLILFDRFPKSYFKKGNRTYNDMFNEVINNEGILRLEPFYSLLTMTTSVIKMTVGKFDPLIRYPRDSAGNVINATSPTVNTRGLL